MTTMGTMGGATGATGVMGAGAAAPGGGGRLGDDARFELAMSATTRERRNRPRMLVVLGAAALVIAGLAALGGLRSRGAAERSLREEADGARSARLLLAELESLKKSDGGAGEQKVGQPYPNLISRLEELGQQASLEKAVPKPTDSKQSGGKLPADVVVRQYEYRNMKDKTLANLLEWLKKACADVPGLEVYGLKLEAAPDGWTMSVTFRRWERTTR